MSNQLNIFTDLLARKKPDFDGATYDSNHDKARLTGQMLRVFQAMMDGRWRTLNDVSLITGDPEASVSARLRDLRKNKFGAYVVDRRRRGHDDVGYFEYRVTEKEA